MNSETCSFASIDWDPWTYSPKADSCYRFVRRFSDTVEIAGPHGRLGDCGSTNTEQVAVPCDEQSSEVYERHRATEGDEREFSKKGSVTTSSVDQCQPVREVLR